MQTPSILKPITLPIHGMTCAACSSRLEKNLNRLPGVSANVNLATEQAQAEYDPNQVSPAEIIAQVVKTGFKVPEQTLDLQISGMTCASCATRIEKVLNALPGVTAQLNLATELARIRYMPGLSDVAEIQTTVHKAGYGSNVVSASNRESAKAQKAAEYRREVRVFTVAALLSLPLLALMFDMATGHTSSGLSNWLPGWVQCLLATPVQFWAGRRFYLGAWNSLRGGGANMDVLVVMGTSAAYFFSLATLIWNLPEHLYFEASAVIITLVLLGKLLEARAKARTSDAIEQLLTLAPRQAMVERGGEWLNVDTQTLQPGEIVIVRAGDRIPVDGHVVDGTSNVDESLLTGESLPVSKRVETQVFAGTQNLDGLLKVCAVGVGSHTQLMEIVRLTEAAQGSKAPIQQLADRIAAVFVPGVILIAALTFAGWWLVSHDFTQSLIPAVAVLVIACPCALGLATPTAVMVGLGRGTQFGILVRSAEALERAEKLSILALDKTGTLTEGRMTLVEMQAHGLQQDEALRLAASLEQGSTHPIALAVLNAAKARGILPAAVSHFENHPGEGVSGTVEGKNLHLGVKHPPVASTELAPSTEHTSPPPGATRIHLSDATSLLAHFELSDRLRDSSPSAITQLIKMGIRPIMLTGDTEDSAAVIAHQAGISTWRSRVKPQDKAAAVSALKNGTDIVGMAGDGINDAPALASADISFSMGSGSDVALEAADITLMRSDLNSVADAVELSRATMRKIRQNLFFAFIYNVLALPLAALGMLNPVIAGAAMALSSVSVVSNSLLLKRWHPNRR